MKCVLYVVTKPQASIIVFRVARDVKGFGEGPSSGIWATGTPAKFGPKIVRLHPKPVVVVNDVGTLHASKPEWWLIW